MTKFKVGSSLFIYLLGTLFLLCSDFYVSKNFNADYIAHWAAIKSIIFVFGGICVFGFDQILMRSPELAVKVIKKYIFQIVVVSLISSFFITNYFIKDLNFIFISAVIALYALNQFWAATFRGNGQLVEAQIFTNGWKVVVLILLLVGLYDQYYIYSISFIVILLINIIFIFNFIKKNNGYLNSYNSIDLYKMGSFFLLNNLSVTVATYGEQLLINSFGDKALSYTVFNYVLAFNSLMLLVAGFLGFYFGPKLKLVKNMTVDIYYNYLKKFFILSLILACISFGVGSIIFKFYLHKDVSYIFAFACLGVGFIKILYTIPSVCMALYCDTDSIKKIAIFNIFNMMGFIGLFYITLLSNSEFLAAYVFLIIIIHWYLRLMNTHKTILVSLRVRNANT